MSIKQNQVIRTLSCVPALALSCYFNFCASATMAKDPLEAAQDLAGTTQTDPNGFTLMIVSIGLLFAFAITLIVATSMHVFKKKPRRVPSPSLRNNEATASESSSEASYTSSGAQR